MKQFIQQLFMTSARIIPLNYRHHPSDAVILGHAMKSFRLKNKKGISEKGEKASLYKEADKYYKVISRKLSSHQGTCTITAVVLFTALTTAALV
uniref:Uncharacterized protein n=1 Tax=Brassica oleracea var. oleracea TaxID=109376 RepID=A0A0D3BRL5_BRAOL